ncbi:MAG: hypothetical protein EOO67_06880 [Microbacterium sp.]|nr:MAG: hypothetical protein EOO67_06880 [Microbacterium sp.]
MSTIAFTKGHGTGNDFVIVPDIDGSLDLSDDQVAALCDRRFGIGGDGILRVVRSASLPEGASTPDAEWFMDYRNADGSAAEMCGNGIRVYARYLVDSGLVDLPAGRSLPIGTRAGTKLVSRADNGFEVDLGVWRAEPDEVSGGPPINTSPPRSQRQKARQSASWPHICIQQVCHVIIGTACWNLHV